MAKLYFTFSAMNAGKSAILLQAAYNYRERGMNPLLYTASHYGKAGEGAITSRVGLSAPARLFDAATDLLADVKTQRAHQAVDAVFLDEAQFLSRSQVWQLARVADRLSIPVLTYGLRTDFAGRLFEGSGELLAIADNLREIRTICHCGRKATMVVRKDADGRVVTDGDPVQIEKSVYVSLCRPHWEEEMGRWPLA